VRRRATLAITCAVCDQGDGPGSRLASMPDGGARLWTLALAAAAVCCLRPARACTVYDMYSTGLASSLCHMVPAVGLFGDNGTFFVNNHYFPCARPPFLVLERTRRQRSAVLRTCPWPCNAASELSPVSPADKCSEDGGLHDWFANNATVRRAPPRRVHVLAFSARAFTDQRVMCRAGGRRKLRTQTRAPHAGALTPSTQCTQSSRRWP